jgi:hypothetical protein
MLNSNVGVFLIDTATQPSAIAALYGENSSSFGRLWFLCLESSLDQYAACLDLEQTVSQLKEVECHIFR